MVINLIIIGIVLLPFVTIPGMDSRMPKELLGMGLALSCVLITMYKGKFSSFKNYWLLLFIGFAYISILFSPQFKEFILTYTQPVGDRIAASFVQGISIAELWMFAGLAKVLIWIFFLITVSSVEAEEEKIEKLVKCMAVCGLLTALYIFIQNAGLDQFFQVVDESKNPDISSLDRPHLGGFMGQATIVANFLAMTIPLALYFRKRIWAIIIFVALCLTVSKVAICAAVIGITIYFLISGRRVRRLFGMLLIVSVIVGLYYMNTYDILPKNRLSTISSINNVEDFKGFVTEEANGRFPIWEDIWKEIKDNKRFVTGFGPGAYEIVYPIKKNPRWDNAHNDPLEGLYLFGIIGIGVLFMAMKHQFKELYRVRNGMVDALAASLLIMILCSLGSFPFKIPTTLFYGIVIIGLLHNKLIGGNRYVKT